MADNSIGRSFQRILFWNNFVTEKLNAEPAECTKVKQEEAEDEQCCIDLSSAWVTEKLNSEPTECTKVKQEAAEDEQCCIDLSSAWISCGAVAAGEPLTDPLALEGDRASGKAIIVGAAEVSSAALAAVQRLADTLTPLGGREANREKFSTTGSVEQQDSRRADHGPDHDSVTSLRLRQVAESASRGQTGVLSGSDSEPEVRPDGRAEEKRYTCSACGKEFEKLIKLRLHARVHKAARPYSCNSCDRAFETYAQFLSHPCARSGERTYSCPSCERTFATEECRKRHLCRRAGERPFPCGVCGLAFRTRFNLDLHARTHAGGRGEARAKRGPFTCSVCGKLFEVKATLTYHERSSCMLGVHAPYLPSRVRRKLADT